MRINSLMLRKLSIYLLIAANIYGGFFKKVLGLSRQLILIVPIIVWFVSIICDKKIITKKGHLILTAILYTICLVQILYFQNYATSFSMISYFSIFLLSGINSRENDLDTVCKSIVIVSVFMIIEAIKYYIQLISWGWGTYNVRNFTAAPKEDYTIILSLAFLYLFSKYIEKSIHGWKNYIIIGLMILELYVNIFIMQSKTAIVIMIIALIFLYMKSNIKTKRRIQKVFLLSALGIVLIIGFGQKYIPDFVYVLINRYTGLWASRVADISNYRKYTGTYEQRNLIYNYCLKIILKYPFVGIGFGNLKEYSTLSANSLINELTQAESGILDAFVGGGAFYGILYLYIIFCPIIKGIQSISTMLENTFSIIAIAVAICAVTNDCTSITFWLLLGCINSHKDYYVTT